ncbi:hypothetical protein HTG_14270 [Natrinema mahii]|nr:hypothetical protein HTG_14270 [Natrinema mahii]
MARGIRIGLLSANEAGWFSGVVQISVQIFRRLDKRREQRVEDRCPIQPEDGNYSAPLAGPLFEDSRR